MAILVEDVDFIDRWTEREGEFSMVGSSSELMITLFYGRDHIEVFLDTSKALDLIKMFDRSFQMLHQMRSSKRYASYLIPHTKGRIFVGQVLFIDRDTNRPSGIELSLFNNDISIKLMATAGSYRPYSRTAICSVEECREIQTKLQKVCDFSIREANSISD